MRTNVEKIRFSNNDKSSKLRLVRDFQFEKELKKNANKARTFVKFLCLMIRIAFMGLVGCEATAFYLVWSKLFTTDVIYLCGWFVVLGCPIAYVLIAVGDYLSDLLKENLMVNIDRNEKMFRRKYYE